MLLLCARLKIRVCFILWSTALPEPIIRGSNARAFWRCGHTAVEQISELILTHDILYVQIKNFKTNVESSFLSAISAKWHDRITKVGETP